MLSLFKRTVCVLVAFFCIIVIRINTLGSVIPDPNNGDYMSHFLSAIDSGEQTEAFERLSETIAFSEMVPQDVLIPLDGTRQVDVERELAKAKKFLKCLSLIARNVQNDRYTNQEMVLLCEQLTKMHSKIIQNDSAGSINVELMNLASLLQCGITYRILSDSDFTDHEKLVYLNLPNYTNQLFKHIYEREGSCSLSGIENKETIILNAISQKYSNVINRYKEKIGKNDQLSFQDIEKLYLHNITKENGDFYHPFKGFNGIAFAANYIALNKQISNAKLAIFLKKIKEEEVDPYNTKLRFEKEFFDQIPNEIMMLYSDLLSQKGQKGMIQEILFEIKQNVATKGDHILGIVFLRCSEFSKGGVESDI